METAIEMETPTQETYSELQQAYDHFNQILFNSQLPDCLITLQRKKKTFGYFVYQRFAQANLSKMTDEIAMNPAYFAIHPIEEILSTLVHEMVHLWQAHFGKPGRRGYHNQQWASRMQQIGLMPSDTGQPGGKTTGDKMGDYIIRNSSFDHACQQLLTQSFQLSWFDRFPPEKPSSTAELGNILQLLNLPPEKENRSNRIKYRCEQCAMQVWGKPDLKILCGEEDCDTLPLLPVEPTTSKGA